MQAEPVRRHLRPRDRAVRDVDHRGKAQDDLSTHQRAVDVVEAAGVAAMDLDMRPDARAGAEQVRGVDAFRVDQRGEGGAVDEDRFGRGIGQDTGQPVAHDRLRRQIGRQHRAVPWRERRRRDGVGHAALQLPLAGEIIFFGPAFREAAVVQRE